jgi:hypothetical protein
MPFPHQIKVAVINNTGRPVPGSSVFIAPLNSANNSVNFANFYTDNNTVEAPSVVELNNAFRIDLGSFLDRQILVEEFASLAPTSLVVEFGGETTNVRSVVNAGSCDFSRVPEKITLPADFYQKVFDEGTDHPPFAIDDVVAPLGPVRFQVTLDYDCGDGPERQTADLNAPISYCGMVLNEP